EWYFGKFFRRQNRSLHKANPIKGGKRPINTVKQVRGFRRFDKVECEGKIGIVTGLRSSGYFSISELSGEKISDSVKYTKLRVIERSKTLMFERMVEAAWS
ncbi:HNH endonuclease, partial [Fervidobacterium islandicum]